MSKRELTLMKELRPTFEKLGILDDPEMMKAATLYYSELMFGNN